MDCLSGLSGDMLLGAMVDAGLSVQALRRELRRLPLGGYRLIARRVSRAGLAATQVTVRLDGVVEPPELTVQDVLALLEAADLPPEDRQRAAHVFWLLAEAEARAHGTTPERVTLHEVGAVDAIVDVVGAVAGLRLLGVCHLYCSPLAVGTGAVGGPHGTLPVPAPATLQLLAGVGAPLRPASEDAPMELVTPTGAAIAAGLATFGRPPMRLRAVGSGAGARDLPGRPNVLRLWLGEPLAGAQDGSPMVQLESNLDDVSGEVLGYVLELLLAAGAADAWFTPIQMKKNRPAVLVSALCTPELEPRLTGILLRETTTLGVRRWKVQRTEAERELFEFTSSLGLAAVKVKRLPGSPPRAAPEYEVCRRLAEATGLPLVEVYSLVQREAEAQLRQERGGPSSALAGTGP